MGDSCKVIENTQEDISKVASPWGNSRLTLELSDIFALFAGKLLYHFDGEYGTFIELNPDTPICKELKTYLIRRIKMFDNMRVKDLKNILNGLPDDMLIIIPVIDEDDANHIYGFRKVRTAGVLVCDGEDDREVLCLNTAAGEKDIADQIHDSGRDVDVKDILYGRFRACTGNCDGSCGDFDCLNTPDEEDSDGAC